MKHKKTLKLVLEKTMTISIFLLFILLFSCGGSRIEVSNDQIEENTTIAIKPKLKVYLDNTGSMDGYMCDGSELKDVVFDYVSNLRAYVDTTELYYINSQIIPNRLPLDAFIKSLKPVLIRTGGGGYTDHTDIGAMVENILKEMNDSTIAIFVSDCILDLPKVDSNKFLTNCQITIKNAVVDGRNRVPDLGIEILRLTSPFEGNYYYPNSSYEKLSGVDRPYYIWIFGDRKLLASLTREVPITDLTKYGLKEYVAFVRETLIPYEITNKNLTSREISPTNGNYLATIRADYSLTLQTDSVILMKSLYESTNSSVEIVKIDKIEAKMGGGKYTHYMNIQIPEKLHIADDIIYFRAPDLPSWVSDFSDDQGTNINANIDKTAGIKNLIQGVADAYKKEENLTQFKFHIKRK